METKEKIENLSAKLQQLSSAFEIEEKKRQLKTLEQKIKQPDFWQKEREAAKIQKEFSILKEQIDRLESLKKEIATLQEEKGVEERVEKLSAQVRVLEQEIYLPGPYDRGEAILSVQAGAGGRDSEDWTTLLLRMYQRYCQRKGWACKILSQSFGEGGGPEGRIGLKEVSMYIRGKFSYGFLKKESGVHRLVRLSPFSAKQLRHTSFSKVTVLPKIEEGQSTVKIKPEDIKVETFRASGPGGQHVNRRETAVRITHLPTGLKASSQAERLQGLNRKIAQEILLAKLLRLKEREKQEELKKLKGEKISPEFGLQARSYVFHPYKMIKDHRTGVETSDVESVLDGDLNRFIEAEIKL